MVEMGVIHGRFQILHHDHLRYLLAGRMRCRHLIVGITNPDPMLTREDPADAHRSRAEANPLTYFERYILVRAALIDADCSPLDFSIVPFPINVPELYAHYLPMDATFFLTIYDEWGRRKRDQFESLGLKTEVLWEREPGHKGQKASEIRARMARGEPWQDLVPPSVAHWLQVWKIPDRIRRLRAGSWRVTGNS